MTLNIERQSPTWRALKRHLLARIAELQVLLEAPSDTEGTATLRGQIRELRALIERVDPPARDEPAKNEPGAPLY